MIRQGIVAAALTVVGGVPIVTHVASEKSSQGDVAAEVARPPVAEAAAQPNDEHPLMPVLNFARETQRKVQSNVQDFRCRLIKRERIDGEVQTQRSIDLQVREGLAQADQPLSVRMHFYAPAEVAGRQILYVAGQHENKMLVRKGGKRLNYIVLRLDPVGAKAQAESLIPVTELGFHPLLEGMVKTLEGQIEADPTAANTQVQWLEDADLEGGHAGLFASITQDGTSALLFRTARVHIDRELGVPVRIEVRGWPEQSGESPPLIAEYTYSELQLNTSLADDCFDPARLRDQ